MLFEIKNREESQSIYLSPVVSTWKREERELEKCLIHSSDGGATVLHESIFGEPLLVVKNQVYTRTGKRADILAIDRLGNGVIVELKRDKGTLGVETQALQYLADFSPYKGEAFIRRFERLSPNLEDNILSFLGGNATIEQLNKNPRIILLARSFDPAIYSLGEWLSTQGVAFRCIQYFPVQIENRDFISFSVVFDRSNESIFPFIFNSRLREPGIFWHNIRFPKDGWWQHLIKNNEIPACFENSPGDQGEKILKSYIAGDKIIAYAKGYGAVGWAIIKDPNSYRLVSPGSSDDLMGDCLHRLKVVWQATAKDLKYGISPKDVKERFGIYHPISTSVSIDYKKGEKLINELTKRFNAS